MNIRFVLQYKRRLAVGFNKACDRILSPQLSNICTGKSKPIAAKYFCLKHAN